MAKQISLENQMKELEKQFGGTVKLVKNLKTTVESVVEKISKQENYEIKELIETQKVIDEVIVANSDAIRRIEKEIKERMKHRLDTSNQSNDKDHTECANDKEEPKQVRQKRCKYFNRGHCKYVNRCRNSHPTEICSTYLGGKGCLSPCYSCTG
jgi:uncharacterized membrane-anchored protein YhcB (DUF1043 family)